MAEAIAVARAAAELGNVPVGAVVVVEGRVVARAANLRDTLGDPTAHAELLVVREAAQRLGTWRLEGATVYVTVEPCLMCAGALAQARVARLVYGVAEPKTGAVRSTGSALAATPVEVRAGVAEAACARVLSSFFEDLRGRRARRQGRSPARGEMAELV